ncbi:hypothetical protein SPLC1_S208530 [Arthrospira platensis C1]|nr:hypothetical protein SPLC1_S208530 [Arthrospira platensis C1]
MIIPVQPYQFPVRGRKHRRGHRQRSNSELVPVQPYQFPVRGRKPDFYCLNREVGNTIGPTLPIPRQGTETVSAIFEPTKPLSQPDDRISQTRKAKPQKLVNLESDRQV